MPPLGRDLVGGAFFALVAANTPALVQLNISDCELGDAGIAPLVDAVPHNTHLRTLIYSGNDIGDTVRIQMLTVLAFR